MTQPSLHDWFQAPLGQYLLERERAWLDTVTPDIFGYHAIQLGLPQFDLLRESRIVHRVVVAPNLTPSESETTKVLAQFHELPFDEQSIDLCVALLLSADLCYAVQSVLSLFRLHALLRLFPSSRSS